MLKTARPPPCPLTPPASRYHIEHYHNTRYWAVYEGNDLLAVTVYKRGAKAVCERLQTLDQQGLLAALSPAGETALPHAAEAVPLPMPPPSFQEGLGRPTEQLALFPSPERAACRRRDRSKGLGAEYV